MRRCTTEGPDREGPDREAPDRDAPDRDALDRGLEAAGALFREIHLGWEDRPLTPSPDWYASDPLEGSIGDEGTGVVNAIHEFREWILPGALGTPDPRYMGLVQSSPLTAAPLADLLVSALDNNASAEHHGPSAAAAEREILRVFGRMFMGRDDVGGMLLPGGSYANLQGIVAARAHAFPEWEARGPAALAGAPVLYTSSATHFSGARAGTVAGIGRDGVRFVPTRGRGEMSVEALRTMIREDRAAGRLPFAILATAGTTGTGAFDPIEQLADLAEEESLWLHVDACYGGAAALLDDLRHRFRGVERAQSIAVDPHKWFFMPMSCSLLLTRDHLGAGNPFDVRGSYIPVDEGAEGPVDPYRRGIPTSRRASALTLWTTLRAHGLGVIRDAVARNIQMTRRLEQRLARHGFEVLPGGDLSIACARWVPERLDSSEVDALQERIANRVIREDRGWFATVEHDGRSWLRFNILNLHTNEGHVDDVADAALAAARELTPWSQSGSSNPAGDISLRC